MVKKKRKAKQKRTTDSLATVTGPVSVEESPLYIDIATPGTPTSADRYRMVPRQEVQDLGTAQPDSGMISGSIIGLTSGEIRIDHDAALSVHFEGDRARKRPSIVVSEEDAVVEEPDVYGHRSGESDPEGPTPAPHTHASRQSKAEQEENQQDADEAPVDDLGPSLPPEAAEPRSPQPAPAKAPATEEPEGRSRRRRNTLPQHTRPSEQKAPEAVPHRQMEPIVSGEYTVVSGEIMIVPEEDIPATHRREPMSPPAAQKSPVAPPPLPPPSPAPVAGTPAVALPPPPAPPAPEEPAGAAEPSTPDDEPTPEERSARSQARDQRREMLRQMIAQAPVPFAMSAIDKSVPASDAGFIPAAPAVKLESQATVPMVEAAGEISAPLPEPPPPPPPAKPEPEPVKPLAAVESKPVHGGRVSKHAMATVEAKPGKPAPAAEKPAAVAEKTAEKPAEKPAGKPAPAAEKPSAVAEQPVEKPAEKPAPVAAAATATEASRPRRVATPLENTLVSNNLEQMSGQHMSGKLPRAATRDDLPTKFSDLEEEFFDKELHPENDYSGLDEVFANMQEQNTGNGSILNSIKRLFVADAPPPKNGGAKKSTPAPSPAAKKPKGGHAPKKK